MINGHTEGTGSSAPPPQFNICVFFHMQSNRVVDGTDDCEIAGQRILSLSEDAAEMLLLNVVKYSRYSTWLYWGKGDSTRNTFIIVPPKNTHD